MPSTLPKTVADPKVLPLLISYSETVSEPVTAFQESLTCSPRKVLARVGIAGGLNVTSTNPAVPKFPCSSTAATQNL